MLHPLERAGERRFFGLVGSDGTYDLSRWSLGSWRVGRVSAPKRLVRVHREIEEEGGRRWVVTYRDGLRHCRWEVNGNAPDDHPEVSVPDGYLLVTGSVRVYDPHDGGGEMVDWLAIKADLSETMHCKNHFE